MFSTIYSQCLQFTRRAHLIAATTCITMMGAGFASGQQLETTFSSPLQVAENESVSLDKSLVEMVVDEDLLNALDAEQHHATLTEAAHSLGLSRKGYSYRLDVARERLGNLPDYGEPIEGFSSPELPTDEMSTDELIEHMKRRYSTRKNAKTVQFYLDQLIQKLS